MNMDERESMHVIVIIPNAFIQCNVAIFATGASKTEQTLTTCSDFNFRHVASLSINSRVRMRNACVCSVQAPSEHYPMAVTVQGTSTGRF